MVFLDIVIEISLIALVVVVVSKFLQAKMIDKKKQKEAQAQMKEKQKKIKELMKKGDEKSKNEMDRLQKEMLEDMNATMQGTMKYMIFSMPLFFGAFFVLGSLYGNMLFNAPFLLPKFQDFFFLNPLTWIPVGWGYETGWLKWYFIIYLVASIIIAVTLKIREKVVKKGIGKTEGKKSAENVKEIKIDENAEVKEAEEVESIETTDEEKKGAESAKKIKINENAEVKNAEEEKGVENAE